MSVTFEAIYVFLHALGIRNKIDYPTQRAFQVTTDLLAEAGREKNLHKWKLKPLYLCHNIARMLACARILGLFKRSLDAVDLSTLPENVIKWVNSNSSLLQTKLSFPWKS